MADTVLVDGEFVASVPSDDRGLAYGDGVFRTVRIARGDPMAWSDHLERLRFDCEALTLPMPDSEQLERDLRRLFADDTDGVLKIMITRGSGGRGYTPPAQSMRRILSAHPLPAHVTSEPLDLARSPVVLACQPRLAGVKHLNRLEQVLARAECERLSQADAWMADNAGFLVATTMRNLFFVDDRERWHTPAITRAGIIGATRQRLMRAMRQEGVAVFERDIWPDELAAFDGALACNSVGGIVAVAHLDGRALAGSEGAARWARRILDS